jgi:hypothetical protein
MTELTVFHKRFGGPLSLEQELVDMTGEFPLWARPFWQLLLKFLLPKIRKVKVKRAMRQVDRQALVIGDEWSLEMRQLGIANALYKARVQNPDAHVEQVSMPTHPTDAVYIEHPPTPGNQVQELLGFSKIEIHAPFDYG